VELTFIPYEWFVTASSVGATVNTVYGQPSYSCIDPDGTEPVGASAVASYGNLKFVKPYKEHHRAMGYSALGVEKQSKLILETNGASNSRALYDNAARIVMYNRVPNLTGGAPVGDFVFQIKYCFSGIKSPNATG
jgi:hypothetical protein